MVTFIEQYWRFLNKLQLDVIRVDMITETFLALERQCLRNLTALLYAKATSQEVCAIMWTNQIKWYGQKKNSKRNALYLGFTLHTAFPNQFSLLDSQGKGQWRGGVGRESETGVEPE